MVVLLRKPLQQIIGRRQQSNPPSLSALVPCGGGLIVNDNQVLLLLRTILIRSIMDGDPDQRFAWQAMTQTAVLIVAVVVCEGDGGLQGRAADQ